MLQVIKSLMNSEKAVASGVLVLASSIMVLTGELTTEQWMSYTQNLLGIYVSGKTIQGVAAAVTGRTQSGETRKAKENENQARAELDTLKKQIAGNDAAADAALGKKFGDDLAEPDLEDPDETPTDPGKKRPQE